MTFFCVLFALQRTTPLAAMVHQTVGWKININQAPFETLQLLPHVGPKTAHRIVVYRKKFGRFKTMEQIKKIHGIGPATLKRLRPFATLQ